MWTDEKMILTLRPAYYHVGKIFSENYKQFTTFARDLGFFCFHYTNWKSTIKIQKPKSFSNKNEINLLIFK
jgi:hypothetical protein